MMVVVYLTIIYVMEHLLIVTVAKTRKTVVGIIEPCHEKPCLLGFLSGQTLTSLYSLRKRLEA